MADSVQWRRRWRASRAGIVVAVFVAWVGADSAAAGASLYVAALAPQGDAVSLGAGRAVLQVDDGERQGTLRVQYSNLSGGLTGAHIHAPDGAIVFDLDTNPAGEDGTRVWTVATTGAWPRDRLLDALRAGECYLNLHTGKYPSGEIKGFLRPTSGSTTFTPPPPPPALPGGQPNPRDAARFLVQATYGPSSAEIARLRQRGYAGWIEDQFKLPIHSHLDYVDALPGEDLPSEHARESIWQQAILGPDQLRQRVALALSEIFVVSDRDDDLSGVEGIAAYMDLLSRHAFGNFRGLLRDVTLSPAMGAYLDMLGSAKEDPETGRKPNENFPREILQLFSIGLYELHPDGTLRLDGEGAPIPTYDQDDGRGLRARLHRLDVRRPGPQRGVALLLAGAALAAADGGVARAPRARAPKRSSAGSVLPAGQTAAADLDAALDSIFRHPNVGPFICRQLIQRLVTSNPSPAYVYRCGQRLRRQRTRRARRHEGGGEGDPARLGGARPGAHRGTRLRPGCASRSCAS